MIREKQLATEVVIDLTGPQGNAFNLMAYAKRFARQLGMDGSAILTEMRNGDYQYGEEEDDYGNEFIDQQNFEETEQAEAEAVDQEKEAS